MSDLFAWKIHDEIEDRVVLTLSPSEAEHWNGLRYAAVTLVSWEVSDR